MFCWNCLQQRDNHVRYPSKPQACVATPSVPEAAKKLLNEIPATPNSFQSSSWGALGVSWASWAAPGLSWGAPWALLGRSWELLGPSWATPGASWAAPGAHLASILGASGAPGGAFCSGRCDVLVAVLSETLARLKWLVRAAARGGLERCPGGSRASRAWKADWHSTSWEAAFVCALAMVLPSVRQHACYRADLRS